MRPRGFLLLSLLLASILCSRNGFGQSGQSEHKKWEVYLVSRKDLNRPISPFRIYVDVETSGHIRDRSIMVVVLRGEPVPAYSEKDFFPKLRKQLVPYSYTWHVLKPGLPKEDLQADAQGRLRPGYNVRSEYDFAERRWLASFMRNRDNTYHTIVKLPEDELRRSRLHIYFQDVDGDGERDEITFVVDMSEFDWSASIGKYRRQSLSK